MTDDAIKSLQLTLNNSPYCGKITVPMEAFFDFSFEMAEELQALVARHNERHAPNNLNRLAPRHGSRSL